MTQIQKQKRIYIDMDDTIVDYKSAWHRALSANPIIKFPQSQHGFFRDLQPLARWSFPAKFYMDKMEEEGHDVWILTRPSTLNRLCYTEKADWVHKHMGQKWVDKLIICPDKSLLKGDLLIDDTLWPAFEGEQILFGSKGYDDWRKVWFAVSKMFNNEQSI
jgi:5'-nucleotidase